MMQDSDGSPYKVGTATSPILAIDDGSSQMKKHKQDEVAQKAPKILPHEMQMFTQTLGDTFISLTRLRQMLSQAQNKPNINQRFIASIVEKVDDINQRINNLVPDLDKLAR